MNAIREFAEEIRSQFNRLIHLREIDSEVFELSLDEWQEREGIKQWKKQDLRRLKRYEEIKASSLICPPDFGKPERTTTRVDAIFRVFDLSSRVVHAQQRAFEYCKDKPHLALLPSIIMNMSVVHRRWRSLFRLERDDHEIHCKSSCKVRRFSRSKSSRSASSNPESRTVERRKAVGAELYEIQDEVKKAKTMIS